MIGRLVPVELTRLRWRRAVVVLLLLAVVVPAVIGVARVWSTRTVSESEIADAARSNADQITDCVDHPRRFGMPPPATEQRCTDLVVGWYTGRERLSLAQERAGGSGMGVVAVLTAVLLLAGSTFVGHDWNSGSMSNQLLFETRRVRVWAAKAVVVTGVALVLAVVVSTGYWLGLWATMEARDLPMLDGALTDSLSYALRGAGFAAAAALGGYALTMLFRSTVATIGVLFAVTVAGGLFIAMLGLGEQWQPHKNVAAIVKNGTTYYTDPPESCFVEADESRAPEDGSECDPEQDLPVWSGVSYYGVALAVTLGASAVSFRRRDVP